MILCVASLCAILVQCFTENVNTTTDIVAIDITVAAHTNIATTTSEVKTISMPVFTNKTITESTSTVRPETVLVSKSSVNERDAHATEATKRNLASTTKLENSTIRGTVMPNNLLESSTVKSFPSKPFNFTRKMAEKNKLKQKYDAKQEDGIITIISTQITRPVLTSITTTKPTIVTNLTTIEMKVEKSTTTIKPKTTIMKSTAITKLTTLKTSTTMKPTTKKLTTIKQTSTTKPTTTNKTTTAKNKKIEIVANFTGVIVTPHAAQSNHTQQNLSGLANQSTKSSKHTATANAKPKKSGKIKEEYFKNTTTTTIMSQNSTSATTTTKSTSAKTSRERHANFPQYISDAQMGIRVRQCSCNDTDYCSKLAYEKLPDCKIQCSMMLDYFEKNNSEAISQQCFPNLDEEIVAFQNCISSNVDNFCVKDPFTISYIEPVVESDNLMSFASYHSAVSNTDVEEMTAESYKGGAVAVKKARHAFARFRHFQTCAWKCVLRNASGCHEAHKCVAKFPPGSELNEILSGCEAARFHEHTAESCHCMVKRHGVMKLMGICPLVRSRKFMVRL